MAYPILVTANTASGADTSTATSKTITMPSGLASGDLIVVVWHCQDTGGGTNSVMSENLGIFQRPLQGGVNGTTNKYALFWKWSDGTESGLTTTISHSSGANIGLSGFSSYRITGCDQLKTPTFTPAVNTLDSPAVTAPWGGGENLFISIASHVQNSAYTLTSYPTGYSNGTNFRNASAAIIAQSTKQSALATDDASATIMSSTATRTIAIAGVFGAGSPALIDSINGGNPVKVGQTGVSIALSDFISTPISVTCTYASGTKSLTVSNITGNNTAITVDLEDRSEGVDYPSIGDALEFTVTDGVGTDSISTTIEEKTGEVVQTFEYVIDQYDTFFGYHFNDDGFVSEGAESVYTTSGFALDDFVLLPDTDWSSTGGGVVSLWLRPATGTGAGNVYYYEFTVNGGTITTSGGLTSSGLTSSGLTRVGLTSSGL